MTVTLTWQGIITAGGVIGVVALVASYIVKLVRWSERQKAQDAELASIRAEQAIICYGLLAALKGLAEQGCNGPVHEGIEKMEKHLNLQAHNT